MKNLKKYVGGVLAISIVLISISSSICLAESNVGIQNGNFETGDFDGFEADESFNVSDAIGAIEGNYCVRMSGGYKKLSQIVSVEPNTDYVWSFLYRSDVPKSSSEEVWETRLNLVLDDGTSPAVNGKVYEGNNVFFEGYPNCVGNVWIFANYTTNWYRYCLYFNSGENSSVSLKMLTTQTYSVYTDDWQLVEDNKCEHTFLRFKNHYPSCTRPGYWEYRCSKCYEMMYPDEFQSAYGHVEDNWVTTSYSTYEEEGTKQEVCTRCLNVLSEERIPLAEDIVCETEPTNQTIDNQSVIATTQTVTTVGNVKITFPEYAGYFVPIGAVYYTNINGNKIYLSKVAENSFQLPAGLEETEITAIYTAFNTMTSISSAKLEEHKDSSVRGQSKIVFNAFAKGKNADIKAVKKSGMILLKGDFENLKAQYETEALFKEDVYNSVSNLRNKKAITIEKNGYNIKALSCMNLDTVFYGDEYIEYSVRLYGITENDVENNDFTAFSYVVFEDTSISYSDIFTKEYELESASITVDNTSTPIITDYTGLSGIYYANDYLQNDEFPILGGYTDEELDQEARRIASAGIKNVRTNISPSWAYNAKTNTWNWESNSMQGLYRYVSKMQELGISVSFNLGWDWSYINEYHAFAKISGTTDPTDEELLKVYGEWCVGLVNQLINVKGYTNIKYAHIMTEPSNIYITDSYGNEVRNTRETFNIWLGFAKTAHEYLTNVGLRGMITIVGPNAGINWDDDLTAGAANAIGPQFLRWAAEYANNYIDIYSAHRYAKPEYVGDDFYSEEQSYWAKYKEIVATTGKPFMVDETNVILDKEEWGGSYGEESPLKNHDYRTTQNSYGTMLVNQQISGLNAGIKNLFIWSIADTKWLNRLQSGWEEVHGVQQAGSILQNAKISKTPMPSYYALSIVGKALSSDGLSVYKGSSSNGIAYVYAKDADDYDYLIVTNLNSTERRLNISFNSQIGEELYRYTHNNYTQIVTDTDGMVLINSTDKFNNISDGFADVVSGYSVTVYSGRNLKK